MEAHNNFLNADGADGADWTQLVGVTAKLGIQYLTKQKENKKNIELAQRVAELDAQEADKLKKILDASTTEVAKTQAIIDYLNAKKIKDLEADTKKKRILPLIGLGFGVVLLGLIFYKLHKQNG